MHRGRSHASPRPTRRPPPAPAGTSPARIEAIRSEGAVVEEVDGDYDDAVRAAAAIARDDPDAVVVSDTSWDGYTAIPTRIAEGYETIFVELDEQLAALGAALGPLDALVIPMGVGALAMAAVAHYPGGPGHGPRRIAVEPDGADCLYRSIAAGHPVTAPGPHRSIMVGMNCGTVSPIAWPVLRAGIDDCVTIEDRWAVEAMRLLARSGIAAGETGAASTAALLAAAAAGGVEQLGLGPAATAVCLCTETATDPASFVRIVGSTADEVRARRPA